MRGKNIIIATMEATVKNAYSRVADSLQDTHMFFATENMKFGAQAPHKGPYEPEAHCRELGSHWMSQVATEVL